MARGHQEGEGDQYDHRGLVVHAKDIVVDAHLVDLQQALDGPKDIKHFVGLLLYIMRFARILCYGGYFYSLTLTLTVADRIGCLVTLLRDFRVPHSLATITLQFLFKECTRKKKDSSNHRREQRYVGFGWALDLRLGSPRELRFCSVRVRFALSTPTRQQKQNHLCFKGAAGATVTQVEV